MTKTYYMITTTDSHNHTKVVGLVKEMKKIKPLLAKIIKGTKDRSEKLTVGMFWLTCDMVNGEVLYKRQMTIDISG